MKNLMKVLLVLGLGTFFACEGPPGPPGLDGRDGLDGINILGEVFEEENINFNAANGFRSDFYEFNPPMEPSDKLLAFILWDVVDGTDVWRALPQTNFDFQEGIFSYTYYFTRFGFSFAMEGNFNLGILPPEYTSNQIFRVVIFPADFASSNARVNLDDYDAVMEMLNKSESDVVKLQPKK
ncbi:hypothetical protein Belba_0231 [Belliella baltica DSM 15883]|uniref:Collagen triple helix repeat protein n=1 Tax=Belliella baltica (strain DSM 15883 / CIP 108006 / LMG 21964 / BA134) TaxID=866536 RepID=I3Z0Y0_BELBD|nr:hypothetical protein [Belliella baltica]AFL82898.1 hypothetical protein Belba_0231 [Belliella baltica DSM 15883]